MKLVNKHRRLWMEKCSEAIFPHEEAEKNLEAQKKIIRGAYEDHYARVVEQFEGDEIVYSFDTVPAQFADFVLYSTDHDPITAMHALISRKPYVSAGEYSDKNYCMVGRVARIEDWGRHNDLVRNNKLPRKQGYLGGKLYGDVQLYLTTEQADNFYTLLTELEELKENHETRMYKIAQILEACTTHKQLLEKAPGIYSNMPDEIKQLHQNAAQRKMQKNKQAKAPPDEKPQQEDIEVPEDLDSELAVAAFIRQ